MSTVSMSGPPRRTPDDADPFRLGWRFVKVRRPDGTEVWEQVPLTEEDVLFPEEGDFIAQTEYHHIDMNYLWALFRARLAADPTALVLGDCRVDWNIPGVRPLGPDVAVFFGLGPRRGDIGTLDVAAEGRGRRWWWRSPRPAPARTTWGSRSTSTTAPGAAVCHRRRDRGYRAEGGGWS